MMFVTPGLGRVGPNGQDQGITVELVERKPRAALEATANSVFFFAPVLERAMGILASLNGDAFRIFAVDKNVDLVGHRTESFDLSRWRGLQRPHVPLNLVG